MVGADSGVVVLDNGGYHMKAAAISPEQRRDGLEIENRPSAAIFPNAVAKAPKAVKGQRQRGGTLVSAEILSAPTFSGLFFRRPVDRGYVKEWDLQKDIWNYVFRGEGSTLKIKPSENALLVTEPVATPAHTRYAMDELVFEEFGFEQYAAVVPPHMIARHHGISDGIVVDSGFSFTTVTPILNGTAYQTAAKRLELGGKVLTNQLKEVVSFRSWNMMDEFLVINAAKESLCYVSMDFSSEMEKCRLSPKQGNDILMEYVLPDYVSDKGNRMGYSRPPSDGKQAPEDEKPCLVMNNERISIPEALFHPSDVGLHQGGIHEVLKQSVEALPGGLQSRMYSNIVLAGGNCRLKGFSDRLNKELISITPEKYAIKTQNDQDPELSTFKGALDLALSYDLNRYLVTKAEYEEEGHRITTERFYGRPR